jgi:PBSX family phage terminase large subunit
MNFKVSLTFDAIYKAYMSGFYRLIVAFGSSRSGKSYSIMQLFCMILMQKKNYKITVWRGTRVDAVATILEDFKSVISENAILYSKFVYNKKDATFTCKATGSVIHFMGTDVISKVLGMTQDISFFNEISHFSEEVFLQIKQRTKDVIFSDYNPSSSFFILKYESHDNSKFLRSTYKDNVEFLTNEIVADLESYDPYEVGSTSVEGGKLMHNGEEVSDKNIPPPHIKNVANQTANLYMHLVYALGLKAEKPNRVYSDWGVCTDEFYHSLEYDNYFGGDFGTSAPTAMTEVKYDGDRTFYLHERLYKPSSTMGMPLYEWIRTMMKPKISDEDLMVWDSAKETMVTELKYAGLKAISALKGQGSVHKRIQQVQGFKIIYTESSKNLEEEYYNYSYKIDRYGLTTDDIDPSCQNHLMDSSGYIISYLIGYLRIRFN